MKSARFAGSQGTYHQWTCAP